MKRSILHAVGVRALVLGIVLVPAVMAMGEPAAEKLTKDAAAAMAPQAAHVGQQAPDFTLTDTDGRSHALHDDLEQGKTVVLEWFNPDCPFIKKHHLYNKTMNDLYAKVKDRGVVWLAINSGAPGKQGHGLERNRKAREEYAMPFPILLDENGAVGRMYGAKTTPHMFVIAADGILVYSGAIDDDRSPSQLGKTNYVVAALNQLLSGGKVGISETQPYGCSVKYGSP
jgi:peroxiredoxin